MRRRPRFWVISRMSSQRQARAGPGSGAGRPAEPPGRLLRPSGEIEYGGSAVTACQGDASCVDLLKALASCDAGAQCVATTLATHPGRNAYLDVLACVCVSCAEACAVEATVSCDAGKIPVEAGSDADLDAETGSDAADDAMVDAAPDAEDAMDAMDAMDAGDAMDDAAMDAADGDG